MASIEHELLVRLLRDDPRLLAELLRIAIGVDLGDANELVDRSENLTDLAASEYRADAVIVCRAIEGGAIEAFVIEVQLHIDHRKRFTWPQYVTGVHARLECPATLVVFAPDDAVARWCSTPIDVARGRTVVSPFVIGAADVPRVVDPADANAWPELAVLSAIVHGKTAAPETAAAVGIAALTAAAGLDEERGTLYADIVVAALGAAARVILEAKMRIPGYQYRSDFLREAFDQGKVAAARRMLLVILESRRLATDEACLQRIEACTDPDQLEAWARRAATAERLTDVFDDDV